MTARLFLIILLGCVSVIANAEELILARSKQKFPEAMLTLQDSIKERGYKVTRVQRVDIGLTGKGYNTDKYRVVFFGKTPEIQHLVNRYPVLIPYLPMKASIYAEDDQTLLVMVNPVVLADMFEKVIETEDRRIFFRWERELRSIFEEFRLSE